VQRSPTKDDPAWQIRLVRGEVWIKSSTDVVVIAPSMEARCTRGEFGVRSVDTDSTVVVMEGLVACHNPLGTSLVATAQATSAIAGEAPREAFRVDDPRSQMDWVYAPTPAHNPQNDGGTQA
jgi:ferric-dicitrate binding protein FerR (iron transport regulator)